MKINKPKYKIIYQSKENVWGKLKNAKKLKNQKWKKFVKKLDKINIYKNIKKPRSLKVLFKQRLVNKQKFKSFYGNLSYSILKKEYVHIKKKNSFNIIDRLIISLEKRLDIFLYRVGLFSTIFEAKQAINHNKLKVNGIIVSNGNYKLKPGDYINIPENNNNVNLINLPYIQINKELSLIVFLKNPDIKEIKYPFNLNKRFLFEYLNKK